MTSKKKPIATKPKKPATPDDDFIRYDYTPASWPVSVRSNAGSKVSFTLSLDAAPNPRQRGPHWLLWSAWAAFTTLCVLSLVAAVIA